MLEKFHNKQIRRKKNMPDVSENNLKSLVINYTSETDIINESGYSVNFLGSGRLSLAQLNVRKQY